MINDKTRADMFHLLGMIDAVCFPLVQAPTNGYQDLIQDIREHYIEILKNTVGYSDD